MFHKLLHWIGWNTGIVITWSVAGRTFVGFECDCGRIDGIEDITDRINYDIKKALEAKT